MSGLRDRSGHGCGRRGERQSGDIRRVPLVDGVDGVINGALHHRQVQGRDGWTLAKTQERWRCCIRNRRRRGGTDHADGVRVPHQDRVGERRRSDRGRRDEHCHRDQDERRASGQPASDLRAVPVSGHRDPPLVVTGARRLAAVHRYPHPYRRPEVPIRFKLCHSNVFWRCGSRGTGTACSVSKADRETS